MIPSRAARRCAYLGILLPSGAGPPMGSAALGGDEVSQVLDGPIGLDELAADGSHPQPSGTLTRPTGTLSRAPQPHRNWAGNA